MNDKSINIITEKLKDFNFKNVLVFLAALFVCTILGLSMEFTLEYTTVIKSYENYSIITSTKIVKDNGLQITILFDDAVDEIVFSDEYIFLDGFTADISYHFYESTPSRRNQYTITLENIVEQNDTYSFQILEGIGVVDGKILPASEIFAFSIRHAILELILGFGSVAVGLMLVHLVHIKSIPGVFGWIATVSFLTFYMDMLVTRNISSFRTRWEVCIVIMIALTIYSISVVYTAKFIFGPFGFAFITIFMSFFFVFSSSYAFAHYYSIIHESFFTSIYNVETDMFRVDLFRGPSYFARFMNQKLSYSFASMKYFYEFPGDDFISPMSLFQFLVGKLIDLVMFASVANYVLKVTRRKVVVENMASKNGEIVFRVNGIEEIDS